MAARRAWARLSNQLAMSGNIPQTGAAPLPPGRFPVKLDIAEKDRGLFLAAGAAHVQLSVVEGNIPARALYEHLGFRPHATLRTLLFI